MAKNIVVCSDGTGNSAIKGRGTNVFKLFEAIDLNGHHHNPDMAPQVAFYDDGVGTERFKLLKAFAGATGWGLSRNVRQLYKEIARIHDPGDRIYLFGFSRGAFTVRTLSGLIDTCGILDTKKFRTAAALEAAVRKAYRAYRRKYRTKLLELFLGKPDEKLIDRFREECCRSDKASIAFLGVWDTVDAVGLPFRLSDLINNTFYRFKLPNSRVCDCVEKACHALAVDDERHSFHPLLWEHDPRVEQVWFAGVHSNVGGGYPKQGMSLVTLDWMMTKAKETGLRLLEADRKSAGDHASVDDKLYNSRSGVGMLYRWKPRDIAAICKCCDVPPALHVSVLERIAHGTEDYAPGNLPLDAAVVITPTGDPKKDELATRRAGEVQMVLHRAHGETREPLLEQVGAAALSRRLAHAVALAALLLCLIGLAAPEAASTVLERVQNAGEIVRTSQSGLIAGDLLPGLRNLVERSPWLAGLLASALIFSWGLAAAARHRIGDVYSEFWHDRQLDLRNALKRARNDMLP